MFFNIELKNTEIATLQTMLRSGGEECTKKMDSLRGRY